MSDLAGLVRAAQAGDQDSFGELARRFEAMAKAVAFGVVGDAQLAEDIAQEALLEAFFALRDLREPAAFPAWFRRVALKHADRVTRGRRVSTVALELAAYVADATPGPESIVERAELGGTVAQALASLSLPEQEVIMLFYMAGRSYAEIAAGLEAPLSTVKKRLYSARQHLRAKLPDDLVSQRSTWRQDAVLIADRVQMLIAVRTNNLKHVEVLLRRDPRLANMRELADDTAQAQHGSQVAIGNSFTPLLWACGCGNVELARLLLEHGAAVTDTMSGGIGPLHKATLGGSPELVSLLLKHGADPNGSAQTGMRPLHFAVMRDDYESARLLLEAGAAVNATDRWGRAPLHWAAIKGHSALAELLLQHGAEDLRDATGLSAEAWAAKRGQVEIVALLRRPRAARATQRMVSYEGGFS